MEFRKMEFKRRKGFFGLGFSIEKLMLQYEGKTLAYHGKLNLGFHVLDFHIYGKARKRYVNHLKAMREKK